MSEETKSTTIAAASSKLTNAQRARIERNQAKAQKLREAKLVVHPYKNISNVNASEEPASDKGKAVIKVQGTKYIDSGGGFLLEQPVLPSPGEKSTAEAAAAEAAIIEDAIAIPVVYEECLDCGDQYADSYLFNNFGHSVCDKCRDTEERHSLITRTEAKAEYLLKDCDFDKREPILRYISRKNPHNVRWGEMKLYLHLQVLKRAMEVWGSEEELTRQHELREDKREVGKARKYNKQMKQLRMEVRSSLFTKKTHAVHEHEFGPDTYNEEEDNYTHTCLTCPYTETYEKM
ncbi:DNA repair protein complementing XP-A cells homolog isoform X2 [Drosophila innubila]|uniref:DNA repair protein complementing XP-A cells homolog isoform X2 n=1 Tax=Drosophila innubila TaxID=198719 RepID=UPI00148B3FF4|nr:DNA repair protein complementing XP-A cells homolog isoform X2 [Drosophila innubila]